MLSDNTIPLPELMLTDHQWGHVAFTWILLKISIVDVSLKIINLLLQLHLGASQLKLTSFTIGDATVHQ